MLYTLQQENKFEFDFYALLLSFRYDPNKGHYWSFDPPEPSKEEKLRNEPCSKFQKERYHIGFC